MEITSITPAIRIVKENNVIGCDVYIAFGDNIRIIDIEGRIFTGIFLYMELSKEDDEDLLILSIGSENVEISCSCIKEIEKIEKK